jgi:hypothetical protein
MKVVIAICVSLPVGSVPATMTYGIGGTWTNDQRDHVGRLLDSAWVAGYISSYNMNSNSQPELPIVNEGAGEAWIPLDSIATATQRLLLELRAGAAR